MVSAAITTMVMMMFMRLLVGSSWGSRLAARQVA